MTACTWFLLTFVISLSAGLLLGDQPRLDKTDLFHAGQGGYETFRVPGIVVTNAGAVLAYCEARRGSKSDWADIDILSASWWSFPH